MPLVGTKEHDLLELFGFAFVGYDGLLKSATINKKGVRCVDLNGKPVELLLQKTCWQFPQTFAFGIRNMCNLFTDLSNYIQLKCSIANDAISQKSIIILELFVVVSSFIPLQKVEMYGVSRILSYFSDKYELYPFDIPVECRFHYICNKLKDTYWHGNNNCVNIATWIQGMYELLPPPAVLVDSHQSNWRLATSINIYNKYGYISMIPTELLVYIHSYLDATALVRLAVTSKYMYCTYMKYLTPPGLLLTLYPHQRSALQWMMLQESGVKLRPLITVLKPHRPLSVSLQLHMCSDYARLIPNGTVDTEEDIIPVRGGILSDEPGLGKVFMLVLYECI